MTQYAQKYVTSSFDDLMQQWPDWEKLQKFSFPKEEQSPSFMNHLGIIVLRFERGWLIIIWTNTFLNMQFLIFQIHS